MMTRFLIALAVLLALASPLAAQQTSEPRTQPITRTAATPPSGLWSQTLQWINSKQQDLRRDLTEGVRELKTGNVFAAAGFLALVSFIYGVLHAVGPGHGKAIISSYVVANERTARRGVLLAFISSAIQALSAIALVGVLFLVFGKLLQKQVVQWETYLETGSYALITAFGAWLLFTQVRPLLSKTGHHAHAPHDHAREHGHKHEHDHDHKHVLHGHAHDHAHEHDHADPAHVHDEHCGHQHLPEPKQLEGPWSWKRALTLSIAVGIRPCTGALLVLALALSQGLFWAGVGAAFAMALGTAITVSALAILAVTSRDLALRLAGGSSVWPQRIMTIAGVGGAALILLMGLVLFLASLQAPARPF